MTEPSVQSGECVCVCVEGRGDDDDDEDEDNEDDDKQRFISYCSRGGWWAEPSLSGPLLCCDRCWPRQPEARSWEVSLL